MMKSERQPRTIPKIFEATRILNPDLSKRINKYNQVNELHTSILLPALKEYP
jgi:hypothetical protein